MFPENVDTGAVTGGLRIVGEGGTVSVELAVIVMCKKCYLNRMLCMPWGLFVNAQVGGSGCVAAGIYVSLSVILPPLSSQPLSSVCRLLENLRAVCKTR